MKKSGSIRQQKLVRLFLVWALFLLTGCGQPQISVIKGAADTVEEDAVTQTQEEAKQDTIKEETDEEKNEDTEEKDGEEAGAKQPQSTADIYVDVSGAVKQPGVYCLEAGSRVFQAIEMAGGLTEEADSLYLNQAAIVTDGQQIRVYTKEETEKMTDAGQQPYPETGDIVPGNAAFGDAGSQKININLAGKEELMTLSGIGESRAEQIIAYRTEHNGFGSIEELMQIDGIKEKTFNKLKDKITVN